LAGSRKLPPTTSLKKLKLLNDERNSKSKSKISDVALYVCVSVWTDQSVY
jgi:hypothetical protein